MNTLISDLQGILNKQFTILHDVFLNNTYHEELKDIKLATKTKNWKWISYFLDRYEYDVYVLEKLQLGASQIGDAKMIEMFNSCGDCSSIEPKCFKYLAAGRHYDLIDLYIKNSKNDGGISREFLFRGLIIADDLETIKSGRYCNLDNIPPPSAYYIIGKYNRNNILTFFKERFKYNHDMDYQYILGQIRGGFYSETNNDIINRTEDELQHMMNALAMHRKYDQICKQILAKYPIDAVLMVKYIEVSIKCGYLEVIDEYNTLDIRYPILYAATELDHLDLFIKYRNGTVHNLSRLILEACELGAIKILLYLLNLDESINMQLCGYVIIRDPRVARILKNSKLRILCLRDFVDIAYMYGYDKIAKILSNQ